MLAKTESVAILGTEARLVDVEVHVGGGLPGFSIVGLPTKSVREAEQRTRSALEATGERWPSSRIVANLAPGGLRKDGTHFDLPIALGIASANRRVAGSSLGGWLSIGELALDGAVRPVRGALAAALACRSAGRRGLICPAANAPEAAVVDGIEIVAVATLGECLDFLAGSWTPRPVEARPEPVEQPAEDLSEVRGHASAKEALEIAAAGAHNVLLVGPPGSGKTMLAQRVPSILPPMTAEESLEATRVYSVAGLLGERASLIRRRPFRTPHHNISMAGLIGGGAGLARPGEVSLAHHGVLFLDELPLYKSDALEGLRGPVEDGTVRLARSGGALTFPCRFSLIAAMNPCPCGYTADDQIRCRCSDRQLQVYWSRLSGPLLDRFDLQVGTRRVGRDELLGPPEGEPSEAIRARVEAARLLQAERYGRSSITNASAPKACIEAAVRLAPAARRMLGDMVEGLRLTGRGVDRVLRVSRTVADLAGHETVGEDDLGKAWNLRLFDVRERAAA